MERLQQYEAPEVEELRVNDFTIIAGASPKTEDVPGADGPGGEGKEGPINV